MALHIKEPKVEKLKYISETPRMLLQQGTPCLPSSFISYHFPKPLSKSLSTNHTIPPIPIPVHPTMKRNPGARK